MLKNFPLYVSRYRLRGLAAEISSLNTYRRALQSVSASLKAQALELQNSLDNYNRKLEELLEESLYQVESFSTVGEPELKRAQNSTQLLSALCFGTMLRIEEQKISEADDQSTAFNSALQLIEAFATDKEQRYFVQLMSKKSNKFEELRTKYFSNEVLICDIEQKPRIMCGQLSEQFLNNPKMGLLFPEDIQSLHNYAINNVDKNVSAVDRDLKEHEHEHAELVDSLHRLNDDVTRMLELFKTEHISSSNDIVSTADTQQDKVRSSMDSSVVEKSRIEEQADNAQKDQSVLKNQSEKLLSLFRHVNLAALKSLNEYLSEVRDKIVQTWSQSATDAKSMEKTPESSDDIDNKSAEDFLDSIVFSLGTANDITEKFNRILNTLRIAADPSNLVQEAPAIKNIIEVVQKIKQLKDQREQIDTLISTITTTTSTISSAPASEFTNAESVEYLEVYNSATGDFQAMTLYLSTVRDSIQSSIDTLENYLIDRLTGHINNLAQTNTSVSNGIITSENQNRASTLESFSDTVSILRSILKSIPTKVERWEAQAKARVDAYSKEQAQLTNRTTVAKYSGLILEHKQAIENLFDAAHHEIGDILAAGLEYSNQACALYLEQLKLTATIKALPCNDTSKHILSSLMAHKRCKKCKTLDWAMCRIEDGFLCCTSCAQSETGKWIKVVVS